jgi:hypothetical protein
MQTASAMRLSRSRDAQASPACAKRSSQAASSGGCETRRSSPRFGRTVPTSRMGAIGRAMTGARRRRCISGHPLPSAPAYARGVEWRRGTPPLRRSPRARLGQAGEEHTDRILEGREDETLGRSERTARRERENTAKRMLFGAVGMAAIYTRAWSRGIRTSTYASRLRGLTNAAATQRGSCAADLSHTLRAAETGRVIRDV